MGVDVTTEEVLQQMRAAGGRVTAQRRAVLDALAATQPHPSVEDVAAYVQRSDPDIHLSTVYRTLNTLTEIGVVSHVHLDHGRSVYHFTHDDEPHLVCRSCSAVSHLETATFTHVRRIVADATGFDLEHGHFAWSARCPACRGEAAAAGRSEPASSHEHPAPTGAAGPADDGP
ncbi:MAG: Fur family transcriptional regulator [Actinomycetota bacterium]